MNKFIALTLMIGFIVVTTLSNFSNNEFLTHVDAQATEIVVDTEKLEFEKSDEAINDVDAKIFFSDALLVSFYHTSHCTSELLQQIYKPPKASFFS